MTSSYVVLDIETTGLSARRHKITEIAAVRVQNGEVVDRFETLVDPEVRIPRFITRLTGIDNEMVKGAPKIKEVLPELHRFLRSDVIVAHNASFDFNFLAHNFLEHYDIVLRNDRLCTRKLASRIHPELPSKRLSSLCELYDIINKDEHRAMGDVMATVDIFMNMISILAEKGVADVLSFEQLPCYKAQSLLRQID